MSEPTKELKATIPYKLFNRVIIELEINNQDELDVLIEVLLREKLEQHELAR